MNVENIRLVSARLVSWDRAQKVQRRWIGDPKGPTDTCLRAGAVAIRAPQISSFLPRISFSNLNGAAYFSSESIFSKSKSTSCVEFQYSSSSHGLVLETNSANKWKITNTNCQKEFDNFENFRLLFKQQFPKHKFPVLQRPLLLSVTFIAKKLWSPDPPASPAHPPPPTSKKRLSNQHLVPLFRCGGGSGWY